MSRPTLPLLLPLAVLFGICNLQFAICNLQFLLAAGPNGEGVLLEPRPCDSMEVTLRVHVAGPGAGPGLARVTYTVRVAGPASLEVEAPRLLEAAASWRAQFEKPERTVREGRAVWSQRITLHQAKPGRAPLPGVKVRFRASAGSPWQEAEWPEVLARQRDDGLLPDGGTAPAPPGRGWLPAVALALVGLVLLLGAAAWRRCRRAGARPLPPDQWALQELTRLEKTALPPEGEPERYYTQLSNVVRRYLAERFGVPAPRQTTAEFLDAARHLPQLSESQQNLMRDLFERCDLGKFARVGSLPEECREAAALAREFVEQTAPASGK